jgi:cytochrome c peroxidase
MKHSAHRRPDAPSPVRSLVSALLLAACGTATPAPDASPARDAAPDAAEVAADVRDAQRAGDVTSRCATGTPPYPTTTLPVIESRALPDMRFDTAAGAVSLRDWYTPCAEAPKVLVIRSFTAWSGPSQHAAAHTQRLLSHPQASRVAVLDLLTLGPDNTPATTADLTAWRARYDAAPAALAADPAYSLQSCFFNGGELPLYVFVDTRTMRVLAVLMRASSEVLAHTVSLSLARIDGVPPPPQPEAALVDDRFTRDEWEMIQAMRAPGAPPPDPSNRVADDPRAARLGETLFNDTGFSSNNRVACASCHGASTLFTDGRPRAVGVGEGARNTPTTLLAPYARWLLWDGRVDTLWAQALGPIENPSEMRFTRLAAVRRLADRYAMEYAALFGPLPDLSDATRFPAAAMPGDASWEAMTPVDREAVNRAYVNLGKSLAAYERTLRFPTTAFDRYVAGDVSALTASQRDGLRFFFVNGCAQCHFGPTLSNDSFHNIGMPTGRADGVPDRGRADAIAGLMALPFRSDGPFSDDRTAGAHLGRVASHPMQVGQFHTPSLRGIGRTGPWGHGGNFATLNDVVLHYAGGLTLEPLAGTAGPRDMHLLWFHISDNVLTPMVDLLNAL